MRACNGFFVALKSLRDPQRNPGGYRSATAFELENALYEQRNLTMAVASTLPDPTVLVVIDEAGRLKIAGLEQVRDIFDHGRAVWF